MISVLLAEDHDMVRSGLKYMIDSQDDMKVLYEADNGDDAVKIAIENQPDVVIMDLNMPKKSGIVATKLIHEADKNIKIIVLTMHENKEYLFRVLQAGASSYLLKSYNEDDLIEAIRTVYQGDTFLYPHATKVLLQEYFQHSDPTAKTLLNLTGREEEVLSYLAKGYTNREIAEQLYLSIKTIEAHRSKIMDKLNLKTRADLIEFAFKHGYLDYY